MERASLLDEGTVTVEKPDGKQFPGVRANLHGQRNRILLLDPTLPLEKGDLIKRRAPSGIEELFEVIDPDFWNDPGMEPHFRAVVRRVTADEFAEYFRDPSISEKDLLRPPAVGLACRNIRHALRILGHQVRLSDHYDKELEQAVLDFQTQYSHRARDGHVGPGTRRLLAQKLLEKEDGRAVFRRMTKPEEHRLPSVFLSYAWADEAAVLAVDQWLRGENFRVIIDKRNFAAGEAIRDEILRWIELSDVVVCFISTNSVDRPYPLLEREVADSRRIRGSGRVIYFKLENVDSDLVHENRLFIPAFDLTFDEACERLRQGVLKTVRPPEEIDLSPVRKAGASWTKEAGKLRNG
jgi:TIR domain-containing protein